MNQYRVIDLQTETVDSSPEFIGASTLEQTAELVWVSNYSAAMPRQT